MGKITTINMANMLIFFAFCGLLSTKSPVDLKGIENEQASHAEY